MYIQTFVNYGQLDVARLAWCWVCNSGLYKCTDNDLMVWVPGGMAGLVEAVQKMVASKADKEEVQGLKRVLGDKVNLADHQVQHHDCL